MYTTCILQINTRICLLNIIIKNVMNELKRKLNIQLFIRWQFMQLNLYSNPLVYRNYIAEP